MMSRQVNLGRPRLSATNRSRSVDVHCAESAKSDHARGGGSGPDGSTSCGEQLAQPREHGRGELTRRMAQFSQRGGPVAPARMDWSLESIRAHRDRVDPGRRQARE